MTQTKPENSARRGRLVRADPDTKIHPLSTVEHGEAILCLLDDHIWLTNDQVELALFTNGPTGSGKPRAAGGAEYAANTALRRLFDLGLVDRRVLAFLPGRRPQSAKQHYVNVLSGAGAKLAKELQRERGMQRRWKRSRLPHPWQYLAQPFWIRQFALMAASACHGGPLAFSGWRDDRQLSEDVKSGRLHFTKVPDGYFLLTNTQTGKAFPHFLEVDLGTLSIQARKPDRPDWRRKVEGHLDYFARHFRQEFGIGSLPVVPTITESERRLEHLLAATAAAGGGGRFWFTTLDRLFPPPPGNGPCAGREATLWGSIWRVPSQDGSRSIWAGCRGVERLASLGTGAITG